LVYVYNALLEIAIANIINLVDSTKKKDHYVALRVGWKVRTKAVALILFVRVGGKTDGQNRRYVNMLELIPIG